VSAAAPDDSLDPRAYVRRRIAENVPRLAWSDAHAANPVSRRAWQTRLRATVRKLLGGPPTGQRPPLEPEVHETRQMDGYRREIVFFTSRPSQRVFGYFLVPNELPPGRHPAVLCLPGHGRGVDSIVGIAEDGTQRALNVPDEYQADFALQCVARGYPTLAIEQISFGHRRDDEARRQGANASSCTRDSMAALQLGETMTGWRVWDAIRALDYLQTRPEVDRRRLAVMGISGGGLTALFTGALDTRVRATVVSGYLNTFAASILSVNHCSDNYVPGLLALAEMPDIAGLVAPRALFAESGTQDDIFPLSAFEHTIARVRALYAAFGVPDNFDHETFEGDHRFHGEGAFRFLQRRL